MFTRMCTSPDRTSQKALIVHSNSSSGISKNRWQTCANEAQCSPMGKIWFPFGVNVVANVSRLPPQRKSPARQRPKRLKPHCNSTSGMPKVSAKRGQRQCCAIKGTKLRRGLRKQFLTLCPCFDVHVHRRTGRAVLQFNFRCIENGRQTCATEILRRVLLNIVATRFYLATAVYISGEAPPKDSYTALQFHFRYVRNCRQTCATQGQCNKMGKPCVAFYVNNFDHFHYVSTYLYISREDASKGPQLHCISTACISKISIKRSAMQSNGKTLLRLLRKCCCPHFLRFHRSVHLRKGSFLRD